MNLSFRWLSDLCSLTPMVRMKRSLNFGDEQKLVVVHCNGRQSLVWVGNVGSVGKNYKYLHHYYAGLP
ncbi:MAG: hypothetical protein AAGJ08_25075 [Cyanobacteria bacterium P01_H01_bin.35]